MAAPRKSPGDEVAFVIVAREEGVEVIENLGPLCLSGLYGLHPLLCLCILLDRFGLSVLWVGLRRFGG